MRGEFNCELSTPNDCGDCRLTDGLANITSLNVLKSCALNVVRRAPRNETYD